MTLPRVFRVALDMPLRRLFDYWPPAEAGVIEPGMRVRVPFGRQRLIGLVVATAESSDLPAERLKPILAVLDERPLIEPSALGLLEWAADYYLHPIGEVLATALPKSLRLGASPLEIHEQWSLTPEGRDAHAHGEPRRAPKQRQLLHYLARHEAVTADTLTEEMPSWRDAARPLAERGWIAGVKVPAAMPPASTGARAEAPELAPEQRQAVEAVSEALRRFAPFVLHGVTGSGKTEVY